MLQVVPEEDLFSFAETESIEEEMQMIASFIEKGYGGFLDRKILDWYNRNLSGELHCSVDSYFGEEMWKSDEWSLILAKDGGATKESDPHFGKGFAIGASVGLMTVAGILYAKNKCSSKGEDYQRV